MTGIMQLFVAGGAGIARGCQSYTTAGTYTWVAPSGVTSVSVVAIGGGASGYLCTPQGGGGLGYKNNYSVTPGGSYTVVVGASGGTGMAGSPGNPSYFCSTSVVRGGGGIGNSGAGTGTYTGDGGGNGGRYAGGAGGYSGNGGSSGTSGAGGAGGGGKTRTYCSGCIFYLVGGPGGGGVGLFGEGSSGTGSNICGLYGLTGAGGGSGGASSNAVPNSFGSINGTTGGAYGGGGGAAGYTYNFATCTQTFGPTRDGGVGAVRIVWPGATRTFPSTDVA